MQGIFHVSITLLKRFKASVYSGNLCLGGKNVLIIIRYHWPAVQFKKKKKILRASQKRINGHSSNLYIMRRCSQALICF